MGDFNISYPLTHAVEGKRKHSDLASDLGKETYSGISRLHWEDWEGWKIIDEAKRFHNFPDSIDHERLDPLVESFYRKNFWYRMRLDLIEDQDLCNILYDSGVNQGTEAIGIYLQRFLNKSNRQGKDYADIKVDGSIGPATRKALEAFLKRRENSTMYVLGKPVKVSGKWLLMYWLLHQKGYLYWSLTERKESQEDNFNGWGLRMLGEMATVLVNAGVLKL